MKRKLLTIAIIIMLATIGITGTLAYFSAEERAHNVITSGNIAIEVQEWADKDKTVPFPEDGVHGVMPGMEVTKIAEIKNTGGSPAWIRVAVEKAITLPDGVSGQVDTGLLVIDLNDTDWIDGGDGFYYYNKPLEAGAVTAPLFASVKFDETMGNLYQNSTATVDVNAQAVQVANNGQSPFEASGWPASSEGGKQ